MHRFIIAMQLGVLVVAAMGCTSEPVGPLRAQFEEDLKRPHETLPWVMAPSEEPVPTDERTEAPRASVDTGPQVP